MPPGAPPTDLRDLTREECRAFAESLGEPAYRGDQVFRWVWRSGARDCASMTNLPADLRTTLSDNARVSAAETVRVDESLDGTRKLLIRLEDGNLVETVLIPDGERLTLCVSSQVGCALACAFCATGTMGLARHMRPGEIVWQVLAAQRVLMGDDADWRKSDPASRPVTNIVFMGMGEPLHNFKGTMAALRILTDADAFSYAPHRITVSTVGLVPQMIELGETIPVRLAVSLHAGDAETRREIMPIDRKYSMDEVLAACRRFPLKARERITFEYVLLAGVNDRPEDARNLATALDGMRCMVNLLPFNEHDGARFTRPDDKSVAAFSESLRAVGVSTFVRTTRGRDIAAACGQLAVADTGAAT